MTLTIGFDCHLLGDKAKRLLRSILRRYKSRLNIWQNSSIWKVVILHRIQISLNSASPPIVRPVPSFILSIQICCIVTSVLVCRLRPFISLSLILCFHLFEAPQTPLCHWWQEDASDSEHLNKEGPLFVRDRITSILQCWAIFYMRRCMQASGS